MAKPKESATMALALAFGPVLLVLLGVGALLTWMERQDRAKERARQFLAHAAHMHLEDRALAWEAFQKTDPAAAKCIGRAAGKGVRLTI